MLFSKKQKQKTDIELSDDSVSIQTISPVDNSSSEENTESSTALSTEIKKESFLDKIKGLMPHFEDESQKKAGANIIRFLALMLILTLVARGTAGATLPKVQTTNAQSQAIIKSSKMSGSVSVNSTHDFVAPEGLTIKDIPVTVGQKITAGSPVATFDADQVSDALNRASLDMRSLVQKQKEATQTKAQGESATAAAQRSLNDADGSYNTAVNSRKTRESELAALQAKKDAQAAAPPVASDSTSTSVSQPTEELVTQEQIEQAKQSVTAAIEVENAALKARDEARRQVNEAKVTDANARQEAHNAAVNGAITADTTQLDINKQQKKIDALQSIANNGNALLADTDGTISTTAQSGTKTDAATAVASVADTSNGFIAELYADKATAQKLTVGNDCQISKSNSNNSSGLLDGTIIAIGDVDPTSGNAKVTVKLNGEDWKQGESIDVNIVQSNQTYDLCLPASAVHEDNSGAFVYRVTQSSTILGVQNVIEKVPVQVLAKNDKTVAVDGNISTQDNIISNSTKPINDKDKVRLVES